MICCVKSDWFFGILSVDPEKGGVFFQLGSDAVQTAEAFTQIHIEQYRKTGRPSLPALAITLIYPYAKRVLSMPQAVLGIAFSFGIPMAYAAVQARLPVDCFWLMAATFFWIWDFRPTRRKSCCCARSWRKRCACGWSAKS